MNLQAAYIRAMLRWVGIELNGRTAKLHDLLAEVEERCHQRRLLHGWRNAGRNPVLGDQQEKREPQYDGGLAHSHQHAAEAIQAPEKKKRRRSMKQEAREIEAEVGDEEERDEREKMKEKWGELPSILPESGDRLIVSCSDDKTYEKPYQREHLPKQPPEITPDCKQR